MAERYEKHKREKDMYGGGGGRGGAGRGGGGGRDGGGRDGGGRRGGGGGRDRGESNWRF